MKRHFLHIFLSVVGLSGLLFFDIITPVTAQEPGTTADPLVSRSYLDQFFRFQSMVIPAGEKVQVAAGALIVLRSGRLKLRSPRKKSLVNLTSGQELPADAFLPPNHLLLVPDSGDYLLEAQTLSLVLVQGMLPTKR
jgi:hypothetical protein